MTPTDLRNHPVVSALCEIQQTLALPDGDFVRSLGIRYSGPTWAKVKSMTYQGDRPKVLEILAEALHRYRTGAAGSAEADGRTVLLDHVRLALDAVAIARAATDEHRLIVICGRQGSGKSETLRLIARRHAGHLIFARPSWSGGYLHFLNSFAHGVGLSADHRSPSPAETAIIDHLRLHPAVILIDEFNHFSEKSINFIKAVLNETRSVVACATIPSHLARMASDRATAEESRQLLRRAVAIIHIPPVSSLQITALQRALWPDVALDGHAPNLAAVANRLHALDTVCQVLADSRPADPADLPKAIDRHQQLVRVAVRPGSE